MTSDDIWTVTVEVSPTSQDLADWPSIKQQIISKLDIISEYRALGVRFSKQAPDSKNRLECHAVGRPDESPSAFVNTATGVYHDSGADGETLGFFDFAFEYGNFGRWIDCLKHYAEATRITLPRVRAKSEGRITEAQYDYREANGATRYRVWRYRHPNGKKSFSQHSPDGRGGWKYGAGAMDGIEPLPYRLPELLADTQQPVWIVEGEKDADRLALYGLVASTNHQGALSTDKTWPKFLTHFRGRECFIIPDNDATGRVHARAVAGYLRPIASVVKVLVLPDAAPKDDVSAWLDAGHTLDELEQLARDTAAWDPAEAEAAEILDSEDATVAHLRTIQSTTSWLWDGWIPNACLTIVASEPGTGKTRFCFDLARRIYHGLPWPDGLSSAPRRGKTLWVVADNQWQEMIDIPTTFGIADEFVVLNAPAGEPYSGTTLQTDEEFRGLDERIKRVKPALVIIDTITNSGDFKSQDSSDAARQYRPLQEIATRHQVPILCVTHLNSQGKVLGRRALEKCRVAIQMELSDPDQPRRRRLYVVKSKAIIPPALGITMDDAGNEYDDKPPTIPEETKKRGRKPKDRDKCIAWLAEQLAPGTQLVKDVRKRSDDEGFAAGTLYDAMRELNVIEGEDGRYQTWTLPNGEHVNNGTPF